LSFSSLMRSLYIRPDGSGPLHNPNASGRVRTPGRRRRRLDPGVWNQGPEA
jgi:hypothetical protein